MSQGLVIPCYNEAERLPLNQVDELLASRPDLHLVFVDDGSTDATAFLIQKIAKSHSRVQSLILVANQGKAEAVRQGLLQLLEGKHDCVGYIDADFATPASEVERLLRVWSERRPKVLLASRVRLLGTEIDRLFKRHFLGRIFATFASMTLRMPVYDTQCGAKIFLVTEKLRNTLSVPFLSRWIFDVELIGRLTVGAGAYHQTDFIEVPLLRWADVKGSKLGPSAMIRAGFELLRVAIQLRGLRRSHRRELLDGVSAQARGG